MVKQTGKYHQHETLQKFQSVKQSNKEKVWRLQTYRNILTYFIIVFGVLYCSFIALTLNTGKVHALSSESDKSTKNCLKNVVTVLSGGRTGNRIFEYASVWGFSKKFGLKAYVPDEIRKELDEIFVGLDAPPISELRKIPNCTVEYENLEKWLITRKDLFPFNNVVKKTKNGVTPLVLWKYITLYDVILPYAKELKRHFKLRPEHVAKVQETLNEVRRQIRIDRDKQLTLFVGVHVRRTDYIPFLSQFGVTVQATLGYYRRAVAWMDSILRERHDSKDALDIAYAIVSDDGYWCKTELIPQLREDLKIRSKRNIKSGKSDVFYVGKADDYIHDLALLSFCNHSIISYGTYGTWSALMSGGWTVYYDVSVFNNRSGYDADPIHITKTLHYWRPLI